MDELQPSQGLNKWLNIASEGARRINEMVADISDFVHGEVQLQVAEVCLSDFLYETAAIWGGQLQQKQIGISVEAEDDLWVMIDRSRFCRVLDNLITNAVEAMAEAERKEIMLSAGVQGKNVVLKIRDTGQGIPEEIRSKIFDPFMSFGKKRGSGLGLAIVKHFVDLHRGTIQLDTDPAGTTFTIHLSLCNDKNRGLKSSSHGGS
jgi:signal transduction histidine kinase